MTPAARIEAAIGVLDRINAGDPVEQALTRWARRSRFAGSKDRAAVRDHVFDAMRSRRSLAALGGGGGGRGLMLGALRRAGTDPDQIFGVGPYAPAPLSQAERQAGHPPQTPAETYDMPDWLWPIWSADLGDDAARAAQALQHRADVHLRVNLARLDRAQAIELLATQGIDCAPHPAAGSALVVRDGARKVRHSGAFQSGLVELQDAASQALVETLVVSDGMRVLDYCAGGGGKSLALAARADLEVFAHDAQPVRMRDLPIRAGRAGVTITELDSDEVARAGPFDLVLCDVPCSGSGAWRRAPEGKWRLTSDALKALVNTQSGILEQAQKLCASGGTVAYATCSVLCAENEHRVEAFLRTHPDWRRAYSHRWPVHLGTDGFFVAHLTRD